MYYQITDLAKMDYMYKQHPDGTYDIENCKFKPRDLDIIADDFLEIISDFYKKILPDNKKRLRVTRINCDTFKLIQALTRNSRDVFGELRLSAKIDQVKNLISKDYYNELRSFKDYGLKIDSCAPLLHRRVANLLYWLSVLKPFSIEAENSCIPALGDMYTFSNEFISYALVMSLVKAFDKKLDIHSKAHNFHDFLYDLHFRNISRSSLEFMLIDLKYIIE
jgi:hypothetical protein